MIAVDDLNDMLTVYDPGNPIKTPNLERLAARGTFFTRAYCAAPICNPSRMAILGGQHPVTTGIYGNEEVWSQIIPDRELLPQFFERHGYATVGAGKILHHNPRVAFDRAHWPLFQRFQPMVSDYARLPFGGARRISGIPDDAPGMRAPVYDWGEYQEKPIDVDTVEFGEAVLAEAWDRPHFLALGIYRPHMPFWAPPENFARYPLDTLHLPPAPHNDFEDIPAAAMPFVRYLGFQHDYVMAQPPGSPGSLQTMVRSYQAAADFADGMVGRILDALDASGRAGNTIVVLWSDHGFHLGDKNTVTKHTLWERANRSPLVIVAPGVSTPGSRVDAPVSLIDIFPTLVDLAGYPADPAAAFDGQSLVPFLRDPGRAADRPVLTTLFAGNHAVRSQDFRYIRYADGSEELYDHRADPWEWTNLAGDPAHAAVVAAHRGHLPRREAPRGIVLREYERRQRLKRSGAEPVAPDAAFRPVIHWDMAALTPDGHVENRIVDGPYAGNHLQVAGTRWADDPAEGRVLCLDGPGASARSMLPLGPHKGVRITMRVMNRSATGQSVLLGTRGMQLYKVAQTVRLRAASLFGPHWADNETGASGLQAGEWRTVVAEFDPARRRVAVQCGEERSAIELPAGDILDAGGERLVLGERINACFEGCIADLQIAVMD